MEAGCVLSPLTRDEEMVWPASPVPSLLTSIAVPTVTAPFPVQSGYGNGLSLKAVCECK